MADIHAEVQDYYGQQLQKSADLKTDACCSKAQVPLFLRQIIERVHPDVIAKYYGCGLVFPPKLEGCRVLDLGCGSGRDVYILSSLVGAQGFVVGVDMTKEQLDVAREYVSYHTAQFRFDKANVDFRLGKIEQLTDDSQLKTDSFDVVVSNCVVNLSPDKKRVLQQVYQMLKPGGEFYFSDVYADQPISDELRQNKILWGECLSGALRESELIDSALDVGFTRPLRVTSEPIGVDNPELQKLLGDIKFTSCTYRMFKNAGSSLSSEALVTYQTPITYYEKEFQLDERMTFKLNGKPHRLNDELAHLLRISRYASHFRFDPVDAKTEVEAIVEVATKTTSSSSSGCCGGGSC